MLCRMTRKNMRIREKFEKGDTLRRENNKSISLKQTKYLPLQF